MKAVPFSKKQMKVLSWWHPKADTHALDGIICDGAVRSGKTVCMSLSFVLWAFFEFDRFNFAICGKTITSVKRNCISPLSSTLKGIGFDVKEYHSKNYLDVSYGRRQNRFYFFGGKDEGSASLIQGMTLAGVMLDEVALMPRSFVEQALARCSVEGAKFWFNCNPEHPAHWFYKEWILKAEKRRVLYVHFEMTDNPSLSQKVIERYKNLYSSTFYDRFVRGKWVATEGLIYPFFSEKMVCSAPPECNRFIISVDYGTINPTSMGLWGECRGVWYRLDEYYYSSRLTGEQKTDEEYYCALCTLAGQRKIECVIVDPSAASFITCIRRHSDFRVKSANNDVLGGIRQTSDALKGGKIVICSPCADIIREFSLYRWQESTLKDSPIKQNDHAMDDMRYFVSTALCGGEEGLAMVVFDRSKI